MNPSNPGQDVARLWERVNWGSDHGAFRDDLGRAVKRALACGVVDRAIRQLVDDILRPYEKAQAAGELPPFKVAHLDQGDLVLGRDFHGPAIRIHSKQLTEHLLFLSNSGGGKTLALCFLLLQLAALGLPTWCIEFYKKQLRRLRTPFRKLGLNLIILRPEEIRWNLLQSNLRDPRMHLSMAVDLLVRRLGLSERASSILRQGIHALYQRRGIWDGRTDEWPTLFDLYEWVADTRELNTAARESILDRLGALLVVLTPNAAAWRVAWNPSDLARFSIVFELRGTSETAKQILTESILFSVFQGIVDGGVVNGPPRLFINFDDCQRVFDASQGGAGGAVAPIDELVGVVRGAGLCLTLSAQTLVGFSRRLLPNLGFKLMGRLGCHEDYAHLGADMALSPEQLEWAKLHLRPGRFIGQASSGEYREPFLFELPLLNLPDPVDDAEAAESLQALAELRTIPATEFTHWQPYRSVTVSEAAEPSAPRLSETEMRYVKAVVEQPGKPCSHYTRETGISGKRAAEIRQRLTRDGFVREHEVATGQRGRRAIVLEPLEPALRAVEGGAS